MKKIKKKMQIKVINQIKTKHPNLKMQMLQKDQNLKLQNPTQQNLKVQNHQNHQPKEEKIQKHQKESKHI